MDGKPHKLTLIHRRSSSDMVHNKTDRPLQQRRYLIEQKSRSRRMSEPYPELTKTNCNLPNIGRIRATRECFKELTKDTCKAFVADLEAQQQQNLEEVDKLGIMSTMNRELLSGIDSMRIDTQEIVQQMLSRCHSLSQQIGQPVSRLQDTSTLEKNMEAFVKELRRPT